jgi:hypothetical protein
MLGVNTWPPIMIDVPESRLWRQTLIALHSSEPHPKPHSGEKTSPEVLTASADAPGPFLKRVNASARQLETALLPAPL